MSPTASGFAEKSGTIAARRAVRRFIERPVHLSPAGVDEGQDGTRGVRKRRREHRAALDGSDRRAAHRGERLDRRESDPEPREASRPAHHGEELDVGKRDLRRSEARVDARQQGGGVRVARVEEHLRENLLAAAHRDAPALMGRIEREHDRRRFHADAPFERVEKAASPLDRHPAAPISRDLEMDPHVRVEGAGGKTVPPFDDDDVAIVDRVEEPDAGDLVDALEPVEIEMEHGKYARIFLGEHEARAHHLVGNAEPRADSLRDERLSRAEPSLEREHGPARHERADPAPDRERPIGGFARQRDAPALSLEASRGGAAPLRPGSSFCGGRDAGACITSGSDVTQGTIISSSEIPPCWNVPMYCRSYSWNFVG